MTVSLPYALFNTKAQRKYTPTLPHGICADMCRTKNYLMRAKTHGKTPFFKRNCVFLSNARQYLTYPTSLRNFMANWRVICGEYSDIKIVVKILCILQTDE